MVVTLIFPSATAFSLVLSYSAMADSDFMDWNPPGSSVHGILQARILVWVAMPSSGGFSQPRDQTSVSYVSCIADRFFTC